MTSPGLQSEFQTMTSQQLFLQYEENVMLSKEEEIRKNEEALQKICRDWEAKYAAEQKLKREEEEKLLQEQQRIKRFEQQQKQLREQQQQQQQSNRYQRSLHTLGGQQPCVSAGYSVKQRRKQTSTKHNKKNKSNKKNKKNKKKGCSLSDSSSSESSSSSGSSSSSESSSSSGSDSDTNDNITSISTLLYNQPTSSPQLHPTCSKLQPTCTLSLSSSASSSESDLSDNGAETCSKLQPTCSKLQPTCSLSLSSSASSSESDLSDNDEKTLSMKQHEQSCSKQPQQPVIPDGESFFIPSRRNVNDGGDSKEHIDNVGLDQHRQIKLPEFHQSRPNLSDSDSDSDTGSDSSSKRSDKDRRRKRKRSESPKNSGGGDRSRGHIKIKLSIPQIRTYDDWFYSQGKDIVQQTEKCSKRKLQEISCDDSEIKCKFAKKEN